MELVSKMSCLCFRVNMEAEAFTIGFSESFETVKLPFTADY
jgi:hypothetical protein